MIYYKIRNKDDPKLYHKGGVYENWSKVGKIWPTLGQLRSMITMNMNNNTDVSGWEVVEYEVSEKAVKDIHEVVSADKLIKMLSK